MSSSNVDEQQSLSTNHSSTGDAAIQPEQSLDTEKHFYSQADNFCLKTKIFEAIEELKMRRELHAEAEEKIQQLLQENLNLHKKMDAEKKMNLIQTEEHNMQLSDIKKKFSDNMLSIKEDKEKHVLLAETAEYEVLKLRDEIRNMLLTKYSLEKRVQELERAIDFQDSSRTGHHSQLADLELKCKQINSQRAAIEEMFQQFKKNVESASEFNRKLEYVSEHRQCRIDELELIVKQQRQDLVEARARLEARLSPGTEMSRMKKQEDTIHKELEAKDKLCDQLLKHVEEIRNDHKKTLSSLSDAHGLIDHYVRSKELSDVQEVKYQHLLNDHEVLKDSWEEKSKLCLSLQESLTNNEKHWLQMEEELRGSLLTYRSKCEDLTKSSGKLEEIKDYYSRMYEESRLSCQVLQESMIERNSLSKCTILTTSQATQTHYGLNELVPTLIDVTDPDGAENHPQFQDSSTWEDTTKNQNDKNETNNGIIPVENNTCLEKDVPCLMDRIQSASPELVSYYVTVNHGITNDDTNIDNESDQNRTKHIIQNLSHDDERSNKEQGSRSTWPTNNERNMSTTEHSSTTHPSQTENLTSAENSESLKTNNDTKRYRMETPDLPLSSEILPEVETSKNDGRCISRLDLNEVDEIVPTDFATLQGHGTRTPDKLQGVNDSVISHNSEISKTDISDVDVSNVKERKPHHANVTPCSDGIQQHQVTMPAFSSHVKKQGHLKVVDAVNQCKDKTIEGRTRKGKLQSSSLTMSHMQVFGNFRAIENEQCGALGLKTDLVAICQTAKSDLNLISQQWETEKKSQNIPQREYFQTSELNLKRFNNHPVDLPLERKKARFQAIRSGPGDSKSTNESTSTVIGSDSTNQVAAPCSQTPLFSDDDDDEAEEANNRENIANQISRIIS